MKTNTKTALFKNLRILTVCAMMTAISVILGLIARQYLTFGGGSFRITFENLPIVFVGLLFGPVAGGIVGLASDLIASVITGQNINLLISLGAVLVGVGAGVVSLLFKKKTSLVCVILADLVGQIIGSIVMKTIGIVVLFSAPLGVTMFNRTINYLPICVVEIIILVVILSNKEIIKLIEKIKGKN